MHVKIHINNILLKNVILCLVVMITPKKSIFKKILNKLNQFFGEFLHIIQFLIIYYL